PFFFLATFLAAFFFFFAMEMAPYRERPDTHHTADPLGTLSKGSVDVSRLVVNLNQSLIRCSSCRRSASLSVL
ncbi:MAG: hypothetical protein WCH77_10770, partial [Planctomycetota bacterium]